MIVVDASLIVDAVLGEGVLLARLWTDDVPAPHRLDGEFGSALRKTSLGGLLRPEEAEAALDGFVAIEIERHPHGPLLRRAWQLRRNLSFTDALYVALAEQLDVPLLTLDVRLAAAPGVKATVEVPGRA